MANPHRVVCPRWVEQRRDCSTTGKDVNTVRLWRQRWCAAQARLDEAEASGVTTAELTALLLAVFEDTPRPGAPAKFTPEQLVNLYRIACEDPSESGRPISQWTGRELADELVKRGIVENISGRHVGRLLDEADLQPHRTRYWLTPPADPELDDKIRVICEVYQNAPARAQTGERTLSTDEMCGIQAVERIAPDLPMQPGRVCRIEFKYDRHGTQTLIANLDVVTGTWSTLPSVTRAPKRISLATSNTPSLAILTPNAGGSWWTT